MNVTEKAQQELKGLTKDQLKALLKSIYANEALFGLEEDDPLSEALIKAYEETAKEMLAQMNDKTENPAEIYLVPVFDGQHDHVWCDTPAPGEGMDPADAIKYVRADLVPSSNQVLANSIAELTRKNSELKAQVVLIRDAISAVRDSSYIKGFGCPDASQVKAQREAWQQLNEALEATPAQCLAEVKAQAGWSGFKACLNLAHAAGLENVTYHDADIYANKIRQSAKAGE